MSVLRLIDANAYRASEGLRVLEDLARFVLGSARLAETCKGMRHALRGAIGPIDAEGALLRARDTAGDVGTTLVQASERTRATAAEVAAAEGARVGEALRVLEEACKVVERGAAGGHSSASGVCKQLRYRAYDVSRDIVLALRSKPTRWQPALCVLVSERLCTHMPWQRVVREAIAGGADCVQLREKELSTRELLGRARELVELVGGASGGPRAARVVVNDRVDVALAAGAHGVHLGQTDLPCDAARMLAARAGQQLHIGVSTFSASEGHDAVEAGADLCGVGPMFATTTKDKPVLAGPEAVRRFVHDERTREMPHLAIGGITTANVRSVWEAGARGIAVSSVVCGAEEPGAVCRALIAGRG
jgi:thiamine-phosphate pyrophosphorylase